MTLEHSPARDGKVLAAVYTIQEFCVAHRISRSRLYELWGAGHGPRVMQNGTRRLITFEAAADWRRRMEGGDDVIENSSA
jgi:hypothetical protein